MLSEKHPKLKVLGPSFVETGDEMRYQDENSIRKAKKTKKTKKKRRRGDQTRLPIIGHQTRFPIIGHQTRFPIIGHQTRN